MAETNKSYQSDVTLTSMKRAVKKAKSDSVCCPADNSKYPYGLNISLDEDSLEKLDIDISTFGVGDEVEIHARAKVSSVSQSEREGSGKSASLSLQITDMAVESGGEIEDADDEE
jgi:hypothetical protein